MTATRPLILASSSTFRQQLLHKFGLPFSVMSPDVDETPREGESPAELTQRLAANKARALIGKVPDNALVIGSDQVAEVDGNIVGKPYTVDAAIAQLTAQRGKIITFYTGLALYDVKNATCQSLVEPFRVHFRQLSDEEIRIYVEREKPLFCAGSFKSEGLGICLFDRLEGRDPNSLIGLPLIALNEMLRNVGVNVLLTR